MTKDDSITGQNSKNQPIDLAKKLAEAEKEAEKKDRASEDENPQAKGGSSSISSDEVELLKKDLTLMTEMAKRTMADLQNLKRRHEEERRLIINMANVDFIRTLLPIIDNLDRAKQHLPESISKVQENSQWFQGIEICTGQLHKLLEDAGVKPIESLNQPFNPDLHEALAQGPGPKDTVIEELEKGYALGDRVIRHAKVKVGNGN